MLLVRRVLVVLPRRHLRRRASRAELDDGVLEVLDLRLVVPLLLLLLLCLGRHEGRQLSDLPLELLVSLLGRGFRHSPLARLLVLLQGGRCVCRSPCPELKLLCLLLPAPRPLRGLGHERWSRGFRRVGLERRWE